HEPERPDPLPRSRATRLLHHVRGHDHSDRINLTTLHSAKGREFAVVILFGIDQGRLPRHRANDRELREARRLFYVGFTRAEQELHIMFSAYQPSQFVQELQLRLETNQ
ncbi:MAG: 3'-5' exonuclease, partial [Geminicoccales bacterium]